MTSQILPTCCPVLVAPGAALNMAPGQSASLVKLPIFLVSPCTMLAAVLCGPVIAGLSRLPGNPASPALPPLVPRRSLPGQLVTGINLTCPAGSVLAAPGRNEAGRTRCRG